jgi:hypothetical protein
MEKFSRGAEKTSHHSFPIEIETDFDIDHAALVNVVW